MAGLRDQREMHHAAMKAWTLLQSWLCNRAAASPMNRDCDRGNVTCKWQRGMDWHLACPSQGESRDEPSPKGMCFLTLGMALRRGRPKKQRKAFQSAAQEEGDVGREEEPRSTQKAH